MKHIVVINSSEFSGVELLDKLLKENTKSATFVILLTYGTGTPPERTMFFDVFIMLLIYLIHIHQKLSEMLLVF